MIEEEEESGSWRDGSALRILASQSQGPNEPGMLTKLQPQLQRGQRVLLQRYRQRVIEEILHAFFWPPPMYISTHTHTQTCTHSHIQINISFHTYIHSYKKV